MHQRRSILGLFIFVVWLTGSVVIAQTQRGAIEGVVTDPSGAVVPGAKVEVTNPLTGVKTEATTNDRGLYSLPFLPYGRYNMTVTAAGFEQFVAVGVEVASATTTTYNVSLVVGKATQEIEVTATPVVLEGNTSDVGTSMDQKLVQDLPLVMNSDPVRSGFGLRSPFQLAWLVPTLDTNGYMEIAGSVNPFRQEALMDGLSLDNNSQYYGGHYPPTDPSIEIIGEFKAELNSPPAEYGRSWSAYYLMTTKSGTDTLHGSAYEYNANTVFNSRPWGTAERSTENLNEFGFTLGGPVVIPKVYNGSHKTFFFGNLTRFSMPSASVRLFGIPTMAMRQGDFSAPGIPAIYDRAGLYYNAQGEPEYPQFSYNGVLNVIPPDRISNVSKYWLGLFPEPNLNGGQYGLNYETPQPSRFTQWEYTVKVDQYVSERNRFTGFFQYFDNPTGSWDDPFGAKFAPSSIIHRKLARADWIYNINPNLVHQSNFGVSRMTNDNYNSSNYGQDIGAKSGLTGTLDPNCPTIQFYFEFGGWNTCYSNPYTLDAPTVLTWNDNITWVHGRHDVKAGLEWIRWNQNDGSDGSYPNYGAAGHYYYQTTGGLIQTAATNGAGGTAMADFVLGLPSFAGVGGPLHVGIREQYWGAFVQDDWRMTKKLTINVGLRWDFNVPWSEIHGQLANVVPTVPNPGATGELGAETYLGVGPGRTGKLRIGDVYMKALAPRLGLAYQFDRKTVFRASGGMMYQGIQSQATTGVDRTGFQASGSPLPNPNPFGVYYDWDTTFPQNVLGTVPFTDPAFRNNQGVTWYSPVDVGRPAVLYMYSAGVQREIPGGIILEATLIGNNSKHQQVGFPADQLAPQYRSLGALLNQPLNSPAVQAAGFTSPYPQFDTSLPLYRALARYPQFNGYNFVESGGGSLYDAGIFRVQKRFSQGLSFLTTYTISKSLMEAESNGWADLGPDASNHKLDKALGGYDQPQSLKFIYSYDLPVGTGKRFASGLGPLSKYVIGGWNVAADQEYSTGQPLWPSGNLSIGIPTMGFVQANRVANVPVRNSYGCSQLRYGNPLDPHDYMLNAGTPAEAAVNGLPVSYYAPPDYVPGNAPYYDDPKARDCGIRNENLAVKKRFPVIRERFKLEMGMDAVNIFNRHRWTLSDTNIGSLTFGQIQPNQRYGPRNIQLHLRMDF